MKKTHKLIKDFEQYKHINDCGLDIWSARELQKLLGYTTWNQFLNVIDRAKENCDNSKMIRSDHFYDINSKTSIGLIDDIMLTKYACFLVAQNSDPRKSQVVIAIKYFAIQTRSIPDYRMVYQDPQARAFVEYMLYGTYSSMDIEEEAILSYDSLYDRYKVYIDGMIARGIHKTLILKDHYGPQNYTYI